MEKIYGMDMRRTQTAADGEDGQRERRERSAEAGAALAVEWFTQLYGGTAADWLKG